MDRSTSPSIDLKGLTSTAPDAYSNFNGIDSDDSRTLDGLDYSILALLLSISAGIGIFYAWKDRKDSGTDGFLMGDRSMSLWPSSFSMVATFVSSTVIIGFPLEVYYHGTQVYMVSVGLVIASVTAAEIFIPVLYRLKVTSVNEYLYKRFQSDSIRIVASAIFIMTLIPNLGVILYGPSISLSSVTSLNTEQSILLIGLLCTAYTAIGGLKAVIWTDFVQYLCILLALVIVAIKGTVDVGGIDDVFQLNNRGSRLELWNMDFDIHGNNFWNVMIGYTTLATGFYCANQMQIQRTCSMPTLTLAKAVIYISMPAFIILLSLVVYIGMVIFANYSHCDPTGMTGRIKPDELLPYYVTQRTQDSIKGLPGLLVASIFAASLSTLSSGLNGVAALLWEDFLKTRLKGTIPDNRSLIFLKFLAAFVGLLTVGMAFIVKEVGDIYKAAVVLSGAAVGPLFAIFVMGMFMPFINKWGALAGVISGQAMCFWIVIGSIAVKQDDTILLLGLSTESCPQNWTKPYGEIPFVYLSDFKIRTYYPEGMAKLYHISMYMIPVVGLFITVFIGAIVSLATGNNSCREIDERYVHHWVKKWAKGIVIPREDPSDVMNGEMRKIRFNVDAAATKSYEDQKLEEAFIEEGTEC